MIPSTVRGAVNKALYLLPHQMHTPEARVMIYAIGLQESRFEHRRQLIKKGGQLLPLGPAKSFWQGELTGGMCSGIKRHDASRYWAYHLCQARGVNFTARDIWNAIEHDDVLAAGCARLLLFTDPKKLPEIGDERGAFNCYLRVWRPGKPKPGTWSNFYREALECIDASHGQGSA